MAGETAINICASACVLIGAQPITSFTQQTAEAVVANQIDEQYVLASLTLYRWRFSATMVNLGSPLSETPPAHWTYAYSVPTNPEVKRIFGLFVNDEPIEFDRFANKLFCDDGENVTIDYAYRSTEAQWPPYFVTALIERLASHFAAAVTINASLAKFYSDQADNSFKVAKTLDGQAQTTRRLRTVGRLTAFRR